MENGPGLCQVYRDPLNQAKWSERFQSSETTTLESCPPISLPQSKTVGVSSSRPTASFRMSEPPFRPREHLLEKQRYYQNLHKHTYLKGPYDKITSVAIPLALATASIFMIGRGIYNMSHGIGKKE